MLFDNFWDIPEEVLKEEEKHQMEPWKSVTTDPEYPICYLYDFARTIAYTFKLVVQTPCNVIDTLNALIGSSVFQIIHKNQSFLMLNKSPLQLMECVSFDDKFDWKNTTPKTNAQYDEYIFEWVGELLVYFQWAYKIDFTDWLKYFSVEDIYNMYYPLHEASFQNAVDKLKENYDSLKSKI